MQKHENPVVSTGNKDYDEHPILDNMSKPTTERMMLYDQYNYHLNNKKSLRERLDKVSGDTTSPYTSEKTNMNTGPSDHNDLESDEENNSENDISDIEDDNISDGNNLEPNTQPQKINKKEKNKTASKMKGKSKTGGLGSVNTRAGSTNVLRSKKLTPLQKSGIRHQTGMGRNRIENKFNHLGLSKDNKPFKWRIY